MKVVYWSSGTKNTERLTNRLCVDCIKANQDLTIDEPYVIITPTYADGNGNYAVPKPIITFLNNENNRINLKGVIGSGNRNFGIYYGWAADVISAKCNVPVLYKFELFGTQDDVEAINAILKNGV